MTSIIFFVTSLQSGGIENYLLRFLTEKHHKFEKVIVYCKGGLGGQLEPQYRALPNVEIIKQKISFFNPIDYLKLKKFLLQNNCTTICDFTGNFAGLVLKTAKAAHVPKRISFYRGATDHFGNNKLKKQYNTWMNRLVYKNATDILSNSKAALDYFYPEKWEDDARFAVIYNGVKAQQFSDEKNNLRQEFNIPSTAFVVGHTGRFNSAKNHSTILKVAQKLVQKHKDVYFIMCGNGVEKGLQQSISRQGLDKRILVFENRNDIPKFLHTMDCYFFPSLTEGQPNALIEAMAAGLPVVASNIAPIKEATPDKIHPYLKAPNDVEGFADLIEQLYTTPELAATLKCKIWVEQQFDYIKRFEEFLKKIKN